MTTVKIKRVVTNHVFPPIPDRRFDWCAYFDGQEEAGAYGYGRTVDEAVADLHAEHDTEETIQTEFEEGPLTTRDAIARLIRIGTDPADAKRMVSEWANAMDESDHGEDGQ